VTQISATIEENTAAIDEMLNHAREGSDQAAETVTAAGELASMSAYLNKMTQQFQVEDDLGDATPTFLSRNDRETIMQVIPSSLRSTQKTIRRIDVKQAAGD
jgi:hypothetical protein